MNIASLHRALVPWLLATLGGLGSPTLHAATESETVTMSAAQIDQVLAGKLTKTYVVISAQEVVDMEGRHFAPAQTKAYLKKAKPEKKAAYVFLLRDDSLLDTARAVIEAFSNYGATIFAVRRIPRDGATVPATAEDHLAPGQKVLKLVGGPNPAASSSADAAPAMTDRPKTLRPGALPARVRYAFAPDETVLAAAAATEALLLAPAEPDGAAYFETSVLILSGAWHHLADIAALQGTKPLISQIELGPKVVALEGRMLDNAEQLAQSARRIRALLAADGGGTLRALRSAEMNRWWTFIGFDIEEPVFVVESKGGKYTFIVGWLEHHVFCFDELRALPQG